MMETTSAPSKIRPNSVVEWLDPAQKSDYRYDQISQADRLLYLGEIVNWPGRGIFATNGILCWGYPIDLFKEWKEETNVEEGRHT